MPHSRLTCVLIAAAAAIGGVSFQAAAAHTPKPVHHFDVEQPKTVKDAVALLKEKMPLVEKAEKEGNLSEVHKESYYLEASVDRLRKAQTDKTRPLLDALDESVQTLHYNSENDKPGDVKAVLPKLKEAAAKTAAAFQ